MDATNEIRKPDISGVSEEIQNTIKTDLNATSYNKGIKLFLSGKKVGISVSDNEELQELGYCSIHLMDLTIELVRHLLVNGGTLVYGGNISKEGYGYLFSDLAFQYRDKNESRKINYQNYFAYPIYCLLTDEDKAHFKKHRTEIIQVPFPVEGDPDNKKFLPPDTVEAKLVWARSLTAMRKEMICHTDARILVGGRMDHYMGRMPGVIEEAKITLEQNKPLYLIGSLGGAAKEVITALHGGGLSYMNTPFHQSDAYKEFRDRYNKLGEYRIDTEADASFFKNFGVEQLSRVNGLTPDENQQLFTSSNLPEMLYYVFKGLKNTFS